MRKARTQQLINSLVGALIVNADDFGLTSGVNRAIIELHCARVSSPAPRSWPAPAPRKKPSILPLRTRHSASAATWFSSTASRCCRQIRFPRSSMHDWPFPPRSLRFLMRLFTGRIRTAEIEAEAAAQMRPPAPRRASHPRRHPQAHAHFPAVLRPRAPRRARCRHPRDPQSLRARNGPSAQRTAHPGCVWPRSALCARWNPLCRRIIAEEGFVTTDGTIAVAGTGILDAATLRSLLRSLPAGTWELVTHPGYNDADLERVRTRLRASRDIEREALLALKGFPAIELISFAGLKGS